MALNNSSLNKADLANEINKQFETIANNITIENLVNTKNQENVKTTVKRISRKSSLDKKNLEDVKETTSGSNDNESMRMEIKSLRNQVDLLKYELFETQTSLNELVLQLKQIEKSRSQEIKNLRKKVFYLLKRSIEMNYETADENEDDNDNTEKVVQF